MLCELYRCRCRCQSNRIESKINKRAQTWLILFAVIFARFHKIPVVIYSFVSVGLAHSNLVATNKSTQVYSTFFALSLFCNSNNNKSTAFICHRICGLFIFQQFNKSSSILLLYFVISIWKSTYVRWNIAHFFAKNHFMLSKYPFAFFVEKKKLIRTCSIKHELYLNPGNILSRFTHGMMFFLCFQFVQIL